MTAGRGAHGEPGVLRAGAADMMFAPVVTTLVDRRVLQASRVELEGAVQERTAELAATNEALQDILAVSDPNLQRAAYAGVTKNAIDTGVLLGHPDLAGKLVAGYDFITDIGNANDGNGPDTNPDDPGGNATPNGSSFHGTHVALGVIWLLAALVKVLKTPGSPENASGTKRSAVSPGRPR